MIIKRPRSLGFFFVEIFCWDFLLRILLFLLLKTLVFFCVTKGHTFSYFLFFCLRFFLSTFKKIKDCFFFVYQLRNTEICWWHPYPVSRHASLNKKKTILVTFSSSYSIIVYKKLSKGLTLWVSYRCHKFVKKQYEKQ